MQNKALPILFILKRRRNWSGI